MKKLWTCEMLIKGKLQLFFVHWHLSGNKKSNFSMYSWIATTATNILGHLLDTLSRARKKHTTEQQDRVLSFYLVTFSHIFLVAPGELFGSSQIDFFYLWKDSHQHEIRLQSWHSCILCSLIKSFHTTIFHRQTNVLKLS